MKNRRIWGIFLRKPTVGEWLIFAMSLTLIFFAAMPRRPLMVYQVSGAILCVCFFWLFVREGQSETPRYFYKWLWALFGIVKVNAKIVGEIFTAQTWQLFDVVLIVVLLRSIHTYNRENNRQPLFFRRPTNQ
ncbi:hypothetical protein [Larkinella arboricola]